MSFRACSICERRMVTVLGSANPEWRCELCGNTEPVKDSETLIAQGRGDAATMASDQSLFRQYAAIAARDPTAMKVRMWCGQCRAETVMTRAFLGIDEQVLFACPCGANYNRIQTQ